MWRRTPCGGGGRALRSHLCAVTALVPGTAPALRPRHVTPQVRCQKERKPPAIPDRCRAQVSARHGLPVKFLLSPHVPRESCLRESVTQPGLPSHCRLLCAPHCHHPVSLRVRWVLPSHPFSAAGSRCTPRSIQTWRPTGRLSVALRFSVRIWCPFALLPQSSQEQSRKHLERCLVNTDPVSSARLQGPLGTDGASFDFGSPALGIVPHRRLMFIERIKEMGLCELTLGHNFDMELIYMGKYVLNFQITSSY